MQSGRPLIRALRFVLSRTNGKDYMSMDMSCVSDNKWYIVWSHDEKFGKHENAKTTAQFSLGPFNEYEVKSVFEDLQTASFKQ